MNEVLCFFFAGVYSVYLIVSIFHFSKSKGKGFVFWIDYIILLLAIIVFSIIQGIISLIKSKYEYKIDALFQALVYGLLLFNFIQLIIYSKGIDSLIKIFQSKLLTKRTNEEIMSIQLFKYKKKRIHILLLVIVLIIQIGYYLMRKFMPNTNLITERIRIIVHLSIFGINMIIVIIIKHYYSRLVDYQYFSLTLIQEQLFNDAKTTAIGLIEHILIKNTFDTILNVLVFSYEFNPNANANANNVLFSMVYIISFFTILSYGAYLYKIDIKAEMPQSKICNFLFMQCLFSFNLAFIKRNAPLIADENNYSRIDHKLDLSFNLRTSNNNISNSLNDALIDEKEFLPCNFFIIFKMIYCYFKANEVVYKKVEQSIEEEGIPFRNFNKMNKNQGLQSKTIAERISRISRLSTNIELKVEAKKTLNDLTNNMGDKKYKVEFNKFLMKNESSLNYKGRNVEFKIESLVMSQFFELFTLYQISIHDVLKSLETSDNYDLFKYFYEMKNANKNFNSFYTRDLFLSLEIYEQSYIPYDYLTSFAKSYNTYLIDRLSNMSYTFLPLIIGIFNLTYLSYNKVIVVYKNPIAFSPSMKFNCWINYALSDSNAIVRKSATVNEIADIGEIEIKNNINLGETEYNEIIDILKKDMAFMKSLNYELYFYLNLFVLNNEKKTDAWPPNNDYNNNNKHIFPMDLSEDSEDVNDNDNKIPYFKRLSEVLQASDLSSSSQFNYAKNTKKYFGSDVVSLLEKLYENKVVENKYVFKLYFSELFKKRKHILSHVKLNHEQIAQENKQYCK